MHTSSTTVLNKRRVHRVLWSLALLSALGVVYASIVPLKYTPLSWDETWQRFLKIPWLTLGLNKRADWFANGLVLIPFGFFVTGAVHWKRPSVLRKLWFFVPFLVLHALLVCTIEYAQIWFPPRVLSQNDMLAGYLGGILGVFVWHVQGEKIMTTVLEFAQSRPGLARVYILAKCCAVGLLLYGLMPLDVMLNSSEWSQKFSLGRITIAPFTDWSGFRESAKSILLSCWAFPLGVVLSLRLERRQAIQQMVVWCFAIELASLPIFNRETSITDIVVPIALGCTGVYLAPSVMWIILRIDSATTWLLGIITWSGITLIGFTVRYERIVTDHEEWSRRFWSILAVPFARAQRSTEFQAIENILLKIIVFAALAMLLMGWRDRARRTHSRFDRRTVLAVAWVFAIGLLIELAQVYLIPLVPDVTDFLLYLCGALLGVFGFWMLIPKQAKWDGTKFG